MIPRTRAKAKAARGRMRHGAFQLAVLALFLLALVAFVVHRRRLWGPIIGCVLLLARLWLGLGLGLVDMHDD